MRSSRATIAATAGLIPVARVSIARRRLRDVLERDRDRRLAGERQRAGEHLIQHDADRVEVAALVEIVALRLLRRDVGDAAHHHPRLRHAERVLGDRARDPEVAELDDVVFGDQDVRRLDVAVHQPLAMRVGEAAGDLDRVVDGGQLRQHVLVAHQLAERRAVDELHHDVVRVVLAPEVVDVDDVRMGELRRRLRFVREALDEVVVLGVLIAQHLDRDPAAQQRVGTAVHERHPARPEDAVDPIAVVEDLLGLHGLILAYFRVRASATRKTSRAIGAAYVPP